MRKGIRVLGPVLLSAALALWLVPVSAQAQATGTGAFAQLSPGGQKIAQALFAAQTTNALSLDDIAKMKQSHEGWREVFKAMKKPQALKQKNLGLVVKAFEHRDPEGAKMAKMELEKIEKAEKPEKPGRVGRMEKPVRPEKPGR